KVERKPPCSSSTHRGNQTLSTLASKCPRTSSASFGYASFAGCARQTEASSSTDRIRPTIFPRPTIRDLLGHVKGRPSSRPTPPADKSARPPCPRDVPHYNPPPTDGRLAQLARVPA